ncbi:exosortase family protein XrtF [Fulvivirga ligni]|uniref:exosortase family protein XrtF n=1 Tax=Fulvivirga ligni TaxID=2904246 RepID=UPI001F474F2D|nr:exosortase family protein XrtF [Fulvivirga ligni]UII23891.1 exosortase family protein XrtF [Fulvivirga ligni]
MISEFKPAIFFLVKFIALYLILNLLYGLIIDSYTPQPDPVTRIVTRHVTAILSLFESHVEIVDNSNNPSVFIHNDNRNVLSVYEGCNGINVAIVFCVFLLSYGRPIKRTLWFIPLGLIIIYLTNLLRIALLYWVAEEMPKLMYFTHKYLFTAFIYVVVFALWYFWVTKLYKIKNEDAEE